MTRSLLLRFSFGTAAMLGAACSSTSGGADTPPSGDCDHVVTPGGDDQTALQTLFIEADAGSTICLAEGTYRFQTELSIAKGDITLRGAGSGKTFLDFGKQDLGGNGMQLTGDGITLEGLTVQNSPGDGIRATSVKDITFRDVTVRWDKAASVENGAYGLYPVGCDGVTIDRCVVTGARDAGIYVGQSTHILITDSEAYGNVAGIELENSTDAEVRNAHAHDNTGGLLIFNLPGLPVFGGARALVHDTRVENNNLESFAEAGTVVSKVPAGVGMAFLAADHNEIEKTVIEGNETAGMLILSYLEILFGPADDPSFEPYSEGNYIHDNTFAGNGTAPAGVVSSIVSTLPVPDVLWDGCARPGRAVPDAINCLDHNGGATYVNVDLCGTLGMQDTNIEKVTCTYDPLPGQNP